MVNGRADSGVSLTDAAAHLGISERTVLRRIKDGSILGTKIGEGRGGVWRIYLSDSPPAPTGNVSDSQTEAPGNVSSSVSDRLSDGQTAPAIKALVETIANLREDHRAEVARLEKANEALGQAAEHWQARFLEEHDRVLHLLPAPKDETLSQIVEQAPAKRPWWRRWGRG